MLKPSLLLRLFFENFRSTCHIRNRVASKSRYTELLMICKTSTSRRATWFRPHWSSPGLSRRSRGCINCVVRFSFTVSYVLHRLIIKAAVFMNWLFALRLVNVNTDTLIIRVHARCLIGLLQIIHLSYRAMLAGWSSLMIQYVLALGRIIAERTIHRRSVLRGVTS